MEPVFNIVLAIVGLLGISALMEPIAKRFNFPYTVLLALLGSILGILGILFHGHLGHNIFGDFINSFEHIQISPTVIFFVFLPALIFESALSINVRRLIDDISPILFLAIIGLLISTLLIGCVLWSFSSFSLLVCLLLGAIASATDPVAVVAIFKNLGAPKRLAILVEGESLFNDATAIVVFTILLSMITGPTAPGILAGIIGFFKVFFGGIIVGWLCALVICNIISRLHQLELAPITLTIALAYLSFIIAEHYLHVSGVMAVVAAALTTGSYGRTKFSVENWADMSHTWHQIGFWANALIFLLVGLIVPVILLTFDMTELWLLILLIISAFVGRFIIIHLLLPILTRFKLAQKVNSSYRTIMFWGGLRGAVSLALAIAVLNNTGVDPDSRDFVAVLITGFVLFTLFVNATTISKVMQWLGLGQLSVSDKIIRNRAIHMTFEKVEKVVTEVAELKQMPKHLSKKVIADYHDRMVQQMAKEKALGKLSAKEWVLIGLSIASNIEKNTYLSQFADKIISPAVADVLLGQSEDMLDSLKTNDLEQYNHAMSKTLGFNWRYRLAMELQRKLNRPQLLMRLLSTRFEVLIATAAALEVIRLNHMDTLVNIVGKAPGKQLEAQLNERIKKVNAALEGMKVQYPNYAAKLNEQHLGRIALRLEENSMVAMHKGSLINQKVLQDVLAQIESVGKQYKKEPKLDLGLEPIKLIKKVDFFSKFTDQQLEQLCTKLTSQLALPGEIIMQKGDIGKSMFFVSQGVIEVEIDPPIRLGNGSFVGELALLMKMPRTATVKAVEFCDLLVLHVNDFNTLLAEHPDINKHIQRIAKERLTKL